MIRSFLLVGAGGAVGSMARYGIGYLVSKYVGHPFPFGTLLINLLGCFLIGLLFALADKNQWLQQGGMLLLASGFCGGFTTFSTFALDNVNLVQKTMSGTAVIYTVVSVVAGLLLCRFGIWLAES